MQEHFDKILYLIIGIAYTIFSYSKKHNTEEQQAEKMPEEDFIPPSEPTKNWESTGTAPQKAAGTLKTPTTTTQIRSSTTQPKLHSNHHAPTRKQSQPSIERMLSRYSGWKKAFIMHELIGPHDHAT